MLKAPPRNIYLIKNWLLLKVSEHNILMVILAFHLTYILEKMFEYILSENHRKSLHNQLCLPTDRPLFRRANQFMFPDEQDNRGYLTNVHEGLPPSKGLFVI